MELSRRRGRALASAGVSAVLALCALLGAAGVGAAQPDEPWSVVSARLTADLTAGDGSAGVTVRYLLSGTPRGAPLPLSRPIPFGLLEFGDATVADITVGGDRSVVLWPTVGRHRAAVIVVPSDMGSVPARETLQLDVVYRVENAVETDGVERAARVPVLSGPSAPETGPRGGFQARLLVPAEWRLREGFPSTLRAEQEGVWVVALPVTPAVVRFRARADGTWRPGFPLLVDVLVLLILGTFIAVGWRHMSRVTS